MILSSEFHKTHDHILLSDGSGRFQICWTNTWTLTHSTRFDPEGRDSMYLEIISKSVLIHMTQTHKGAININIKLLCRFSGSHSGEY
jgi:hypothetical protein